MEFNKLIPELSVSNISKSRKFYEDLGFVVKYERVQDKFCFIEYQGNQLMIEEINDNWDTGAELKYPFGRGINISMEVSDIEEVYNNAKKANYEIFIDIMINKYKADDVEYLDREFLIQDPDGYLLRFNDSKCV